MWPFKRRKPLWSIICMGYRPADRWNAAHTVLIPDYVVLQHVTGETIEMVNPR